MMEDAELLRRFAATRSEEAFAELVRRHLDRVYAVALRQVGGDGHLAQDVAQKVFTALARKAPALAERAVIGGWLYRTTQFTAIDVVRAERRRRAREQEAQTMNELTSDPVSAAEWERLRPVLEAAVGELNDADRDAVWLRFFEGRSFAEIGATLRLTENTARMRVERALEKLRGRLARRGVTSTAAALAVVLAQPAAAAAPAGLATLVTGTALAGTTGLGASGVWFAFFTMNKIKIGVASLLLAGAMTSALVEWQTSRALGAELKAIEADGAAVRAENRRLTDALEKFGAQGASTGPNEAGELVRRRARIAQLKARPDGVVDAAMKPPTNAGWATPAAAFETLNWAMVTGDWAEFARGWTFHGDTKAAADAMFAGLSPAMRETYGTSERWIAHVLVSASVPNRTDWMESMQVLDTQLIDGPAPMRVRAWRRTGTGKEFAEDVLFERSSSGWSISASGVASMVKMVLSRIDPATGEPRAKTK